PGGSFIINYVARTLVAVLDWKLDIQAAIDAPNYGSRNGPTEIERGSAYEALVPALQARGHQVRLMEMESGLHGIERGAGHEAQEGSARQDDASAPCGRARTRAPFRDAGRAPCGEPGGVDRRAAGQRQDDARGELSRPRAHRLALVPARRR